MIKFPENLSGLHGEEENLYGRSRDAIDADENLILHVCAVEATMDLLYAFRLPVIEDEDFKVIQVLGMRVFNTLSSSFKLMMSGYYQTSALVMRDALETAFLIDFFSSDHTSVSKWRMATEKERKQLFKPVKIREALDSRDGFTGQKRAKAYELLSELAAHPSMWGISMLRPKDGDIHLGPFFDPTALKAGLEELARLALQTGEIINRFIPLKNQSIIPSCIQFSQVKSSWFKKFYGSSLKEDAN